MAWFHRLLDRLSGWSPEHAPEQEPTAEQDPSPTSPPEPRTEPGIRRGIWCSHPYWSTCTRRRGPNGVYANWSRCTTCGAWARC